MLYLLQIRNETMEMMLNEYCVKDKCFWCWTLQKNRKFEKEENAKERTDERKTNFR